MVNYVIREFCVGEPVFGDCAREAAAKLLDLAGAPLADRDNLLHYHEGSPRQGFSPVKFLGRKDGFALLGYGPGMAIVDEVAPALAGAWAVHKRRHVLQHRREGECLIAPLPFRLQHRLPRVVIQKKPEHLDRFKADPADHLRRIVVNGVQRQCEFLGIATPSLDVEILEWELLKPAKHSSGKFHVARCDISAAINVVFRGPWSFGYLTSHGYGHFNADLAAAAALGKRMETAYVGK